MRFETISPFLVTEKNKFSKWLTYAGLGMGITLLLCAVQMYINLNGLLQDRKVRNDGYDYVSVSRAITNDNMGKDNRFTAEDVAHIRSQPFVADAAPLVSNEFRAMISAGNIVPFSTDLFLEAIRDDFIDTVPASFTWQPGQSFVPIIFSADYLEMYNIFAPGQELPQLSPESIGALRILLECTGPGGTQQFSAGIVAVSDRISSILVPEAFLRYANEKIGRRTDAPAARVFIKTKDANSSELLQFIDDNGYRINKDRMRFGRIKQSLQAAVSGMGIFAALVILLSLLLFSYFLKLMVARSRENLQLLLTLGYSPKWLAGVVSRKWIPVYVTLTLIALLLTCILQWVFKSGLEMAHQVTLLPSVWLFLLSGFIILLCIYQNRITIRKQVQGL